MSRGTASRQHLLGAHVSTAGGVDRAPARGRLIGANAIQVFTKTPSQWREPVATDEMAAAFQQAVRRERIQTVLAHDSYLINLASPQRTLRRRSIICLQKELERCRRFAIPYVVTHPGNFIGRRLPGLRRNADAYVECLTTVPGPMILIETTAGTGTSLGATFEELAELRARLPAALQGRVGFCADTCHLYSAGHDIVTDWDGIWAAWERIIGLRHLRCIHLNDSKTPFASRRDRHELIGEGTLGPGPFRSVMRDPRFAHVIKIIETPKGDDPVGTDRRMLRRLRAYARPAPRSGEPTRFD